MVGRVTATTTGASAQTTGVGREGMVGVSLFMGGETTSSSAVVHTGGYGYRLERRLLLQEFRRGGALQRALLNYTQALMAQIAQTAACYRHHNVEQQLSGWLMATQDRLPQAELVMTQELLASLLGVRRESITQAAGSLQDAGCIRYRRGHITVLGTAGHVLPALAAKAELARIGRYYATESMLVLDPATGRYDAAATPSTGQQTLFEHYARLLRGDVRDERGDHAVF